MIPISNLILYTDLPVHEVNGVIIPLLQENFYACYCCKAKLSKLEVAGAEFTTMKDHGCARIYAHIWCPQCSVDSVIPYSVKEQVSKENWEKAHDFWFSGISPDTTLSKN